LEYDNTTEQYKKESKSDTMNEKKSSEKKETVGQEKSIYQEKGSKRQEEAK